MTTDIELPDDVPVLANNYAVKRAGYLGREGFIATKDAFTEGYRAALAALSTQPETVEWEYGVRFPHDDAGPDHEGLPGGAIGIWEFGHPLTNLAGVPADGSVMPNLVPARGIATTGLTMSDLNLAVVNVGLTGAAGQVTRTAKGGIHAAIASTTTAIGSGFGLRTSANFAAWLLTNYATRTIVWALWYLPTAPPTQPTSRLAVATSAFAAHIRSTGFDGGISSPGGFYPAGLPWEPATAGTPQLRIQGGSATITGTPTAYPMIHGNLGPYNPYSGRAGAAGSDVLYRVEAYDLAATGLTFAALSTKLQGEYAAQVTAASGRYYGDAWTPALATATPASAAAGATVTITGSGLATVTAVTVGGVTATLTGTATATSRTFTMPAGTAGSAPIIATNPQGASLALPYTRT